MIVAWGSLISKPNGLLRCLMSRPVTQFVPLLKFTGGVETPGPPRVKYGGLASSKVVNEEKRVVFGIVMFEICEVKDFYLLVSATAV